MNGAEKYDVLVLGADTAGKLMAWTMAREGKRTAVVERKYIGGSCPNVACLPSKNVIHSAKVASLVERHREFGIETGPISIDMAGVYARKREMVEGIVRVHLDKFHAALNQHRGDELVLGDGAFVAPRTPRVALRDGGERTLIAERVFVNLGSRATIPGTRGLRESRPMTHIEALDLQRRPEHLIVLGGGYVGLEMAQSLGRLGSRVTLIERGSQLASREDADVAEAIPELFRDEGIDVLLRTYVPRVNGISGEHVSLQLQSGNAGLSQAHLFQRARQRRTLCGLGTAEALFGRSSRGLQITARLSGLRGIGARAMRALIQRGTGELPDSTAAHGFLHPSPRESTTQRRWQ